MTAWVRSYVVAEQIERQQTAQTSVRWHGMRYSRGAVAFDSLQVSYNENHPFGWPDENVRGVWWSYKRLPEPPNLYAEKKYDSSVKFEFAGVQLKTSAQNASVASTFAWHVIVPLWPSLLFALPPLLWLRKIKKPAGRGFDLQPPTQARS